MTVIHTPVHTQSAVGRKGFVFGFLGSRGVLHSQSGVLIIRLVMILVVTGHAEYAVSLGLRGRAAARRGRHLHPHLLRLLRLRFAMLLPLLIPRPLVFRRLRPS